jgi:hypothetical protein
MEQYKDALKLSDPAEIALILYAKEQRDLKQHRKKKVRHIMVGYNSSENAFYNIYQQNKQIYNCPTFFDLINEQFEQIPIQARFQLLVSEDNIHWFMLDIKKISNNKISFFLFDPIKHYLTTQNYLEKWRSILWSQLSNIPKIKLRIAYHPQIQFDGAYCATFALDAIFRLQHLDLHELLMEHPNVQPIPLGKLDPSITAILLRNSENAEAEVLHNIQSWKTQQINCPDKPIKTLDERILQYTPQKQPVTNCHHYKNIWGYSAIVDKTEHLRKKTSQILIENNISSALFDAIFSYFANPTANNLLELETHIQPKTVNLPLMWWKYQLFFNV